LLPLELICLFDAEITLPASFGLTVAGSNEVVGAFPDRYFLARKFAVQRSGSAPQLQNTNPKPGREK
jgi:hypothetical protein